MPSAELEKSDMNGNLESERDKHDSVEGAEAVASSNTRKIISTGKVEDRPNFVKATPAVKQRTLPKHDNPSTLKRFKSETDLLDDSFDKPPTVISKKRDNTLISKIYLDPNVRSFALSNRNQVPAESAEVNKPTLKNQLSLDANVFAQATNNNLKISRNNSEDFTPINNDRKKSYYSSEEDLSSNHSSKNEHIGAFKGFQNANVRRRRINSRPSVSSEDGLLSDGSITLEKPLKGKSTRGLIYSSSEDLLSIEELEKVPKKKDNTLISRIYQDPNVRNFALSNRDYIPVFDEAPPKTPKHFSSSEDLLSEQSIYQFRDVEKTNKTQVSNGLSFSSGVSLENLIIEDVTLMPPIKQSTEDAAVYERKMTTPDPDINELAKKKIVHNILGQFTKSHPKTTSRLVQEVPRERKMSTDTDEVTISVKDLKKKFENNDAKSKVVSSLTARSLSKQMRETLKN